MAKKEQEKIMLAEHVFEVRHAASGSFLDVRGYVADYIRNEGILPHWKIDTNVVNFRDLPNKIKQEGAFAGYKSLGYIVYNPETRNYFVDKSSSFWRSILKNKHYTIPEATRFGARTKFFLPSQLSFDEINKLVYETYYTQKIRDLIGGKETDVQFIIEFKEKQFDVRLSGGPLHESEASNYFNFNSDQFDKCGLFLDIDYSKIENLSQSEIPKLLKEAVNLTWTKVETIASALGL